MRDLEQAAEAAGVSTEQLMENAGLSVAQEAWMLLGSLEDRRIVVLCGPGNNGGDGLVAARHLDEWGVQVLVFLMKPRPDDSLVTTLQEREVAIMTAQDDGALDDLRDILPNVDLIIDALLGTGRARPIEGVMARVLESVKAAREGAVRPKLLSVDVPTGLDADSGSVDPLTVAADET